MKTLIMSPEEKLAAREQRRKELKQFRENLFRESLIEKIVNEYGFSHAIAKACVDKGWEDGQAYGYEEIRTQTKIAADFVYKILNMNMC